MESYVYLHVKGPKDVVANTQRMCSRSVPFRRTVTDAVSWRQDQAQNATIYILRETGPTGFLLKEEGETKEFKVFLGDPHTCTCPVYKKEKDLCKHICWILLKKFRIPREDTESFQLGLVEREINALLRGRTRRETTQRHNQSKNKAHQTVAVTDDGREVLAQREITEEDVCPICQDEFLSTREPVTYCRFGCAKSIHIKCMKVWADHQNTTGEENIKCPLCREDFGHIEFLQKELRNSSLQKTRAERGIIHRGVVCSQCNQSPIAGRCYRCVECKNKFLCQECYSSNAHSQHEFQYRQKPNQRWRPAQRGSGGVLPPAVLEDLQNRELQDGDYELLLQLDGGDANKASTIPEEVVRSFPTETVREGGALTVPGVQCRVCLRGFTRGQIARRLPCRHKFHRECIDQWLIHQHPTCPVDGTVVWNPLTANLNTPAKKVKQKKKSAAQKDDPSRQLLDLTGLGILNGRQVRGLIGQKRTGPAPLPNGSGSIDLLPAEFQLMGLGITSRDNGPSSSSGDSTEGTDEAPRRVGKPRILQNSDRLFTLSSSTHYTVHDLNANSNLSSLPNGALPMLDIHGAIITNGHHEETGMSPSSRASWLSGDTSRTIRDIGDINGNNYSQANPNQLTDFNENDHTWKPRHKPPSGSKGGRSKIQRMHPKHEHIVSIPSRNRANNFELIASRFTLSNSAPSLSEVGAGGSPVGTPERGRPNKEGRKVNGGQRARSSSIDRRSSHQSGLPDNRLEVSYEPSKLSKDLLTGKKSGRCSRTRKEAVDVND